ncbi:hypothetical protein CMI47_12375 [Candidatus Pacearchaeota archaeon]|mgnify:CR=1 FL=1|jgi:hypothetical protein|nr:hypothetical protein [Candidatus Pacearchaeota archaeon]|tara:strand:- start:97 stop:612 length:516 start_codon:yes stop_codon:yes gene_type:complete
MFKLNDYLSELVVEQDDPELMKALDIVELTELVCDDAWLARQDHYGSAGAMERQIEYLGTTLLPNAEAKLSRMESRGVIGESYTQDSWFGTANEEDPHINDEIPFDQQVEDQKNFIDQLKGRMRTAAILFVTRVRAHDALSMTLDQLSYSGIKAKAESNRQARAAQGAVAV